MKCQKCGQETFLPFRCQYCGGYFCSEHRLPENHECPQIQQARLPKEEPQPTTVQKQKSYEYTLTYPTLKPPQSHFYFSQKEITHLALATLLVTGVGLSLGGFTDATYGGCLILALSIAAFTASFLMHEIAHKITAQKHGLWAEFRLTLMGAILTALSIISPFKFISPGAVMVSGYADKKTLGKTAIAGPTTNIILAILLTPATFLLPEYAPIFAPIAAFNAWIALINLIPFGIFDGFKVYLWDKKIWALTFATSVALTIVLTAAFFNGFW